MKPERVEAIKLRKDGFSYNEIAKKLSISKSTLSSWLKDVQLSKQAKDRLQKRVYQGTINGLIKRNKAQTTTAQKRSQEIQSKASAEIQSFSKDDIKIIGTALYWAEGYKRSIVRDGKEITSHAISFVNADPCMIRIFIRFLTEVLEIDSKDIIATMRLYPTISENEALDFWQKETDLPLENFRKSTFQVSSLSKDVRPKDRLPYGTLQIGVYKTAKFHEILGLIQGMKYQAECATI